MATFETIDDYIGSLPPDVQPVFRSVRQTMRAATPGTDEGISYGIPTLRLDGRSFVSFAAWRKHVSVYPIPSGDAELMTELARYVAGRGTLRFPLDTPLPLGLIGRVAAELLRQRRSGTVRSWR
jgi:uncharacterized protein YdhG (YjbR/CyaY superfamily)